MNKGMGCISYSSRSNTMRVNSFELYSNTPYPSSYETVRLTMYVPTSSTSSDSITNSAVLSFSIYKNVGSTNKSSFVT